MFRNKKSIYLYWLIALLFTVIALAILEINAKL